MPVQVTFELDDTLYEKWQALAGSAKCTVEHLLAFALDDCYEDQRDLVESQLEADRDMEAGHLIPHEEVVAWIKSLSTDKPLPNPADRFNRELVS